MHLLRAPRPRPARHAPGEGGAKRWVSDDTLDNAADLTPRWLGKKSTATRTSHDARRRIADIGMRWDGEAEHDRDVDEEPDESRPAMITREQRAHIGARIDELCDSVAALQRGRHRGDPRLTQIAQVLGDLKNTYGPGGAADAIEAFRESYEGKRPVRAKGARGRLPRSVRTTTITRAEWEEGA